MSTLNHKEYKDRQDKPIVNPGFTLKEYEDNKKLALYSKLGYTGF